MSDPKIEIYTKLYCGYCHRAKRLLKDKGVDFVEHDITLGGEHKRALEQRLPGYGTVPQIFIHGKAIGGSDDLHTLESEGRLDAMLAGTAD